MNKLIVLVTRPTLNSQRLLKLLAQQHIETVHMPLFEIAPFRDPELETALPDIAAADWLIFTSANAVNMSFADPALQHVLRQMNWQHTHIATVGAATSRALTAHEVPVMLQPEQHFHSEALLALAPLADLTGKRVGIIKGYGGRLLLADSCQKRGAKVTIINCYQRQTMAYRELPAGLDEVTMLTCTSSEALLLLHPILVQNSLRQLLRLPLIVSSERLRKLARSLQFSNVILSDNASDEALLSSILSYQQ